MADATVKGTLRTFGVRANVNASVSCVNNRPTGTINGTATVRRLFRTEVITFSSSTAVFVRTRRVFHNRVEAEFRNVTVRNLTTGRVFTGCKLFLSATEVAPGVFFATITIICRGVRIFRIFGFFSGKVIVNRVVTCGAIIDP